MNKSQIILLSGLAALGLGNQHPEAEKQKPSTKPKFSEKDLLLLRSYPKKERKKMVEELKAKYRSNQ